MRSLLAALQLLTRIPLAGFAPVAADRARAPYWYGAVGLGLGVLLAAAERGFQRLLPAAPALALVLCLNALLTGALHLDGFADTVDGLGGRDAAHALAIMRDSRLGAYGVLGLLALIGLQFSALLALPQPALTRALVLAPGWGRAALVLAAAVGRPARNEGLGADFLHAIRLRHALFAFAPVALVAVWIEGLGCLPAAAASVVLALGLAAGFRRRLGGQTGDTLGCVNEAVETATYWLPLVIR